MEKVINVCEFRCHTPMAEPYTTVCPSDPPGSITQSFVTANPPLDNVIRPRDTLLKSFNVIIEVRCDASGHLTT